MSKKGKLGTLITGALVGAGLGILFAPKSGKETREDLKKKLEELKEKASDIDADDVKAYVVRKTEEIENALKDLDKEKIKKIAEKKAREIQKSALDLVNYAKEKSQPVLEDTAESLRLKAVAVTKSILKKLEEK